MPSFHDFFLQTTTHAVLASMEITEPTPVQVAAIPALLAGKDLVGQSPTGSGKTLAYGIPLVERLSKDKRVVQALVLVPTRELAVQVNAVLCKLATSRRLSTALLVGGRPYGNQLSALRYGAQIVVGTPGRVKDHLDRGSLVLSQLRVCVLDEADQMLDSGFAPAIEEILATTPDTRQMAMFSATMPDWVATLRKKFLHDPVILTITAAMGAQSTIEQIAYQVPQEKKMAALCTLLHSSEGESSLIFGRTKFGVERLGKQLSGLGFTVGTLHGNKSQRAREEVLTAFRRGQVQTLLATNVAARGLDIEGIYQVINYELPESSDLFTHRIGRTGRMGRQGKAITLLVPSDMPKWRRMAQSLGQAVVLQRLAIDEDGGVTLPVAMPEVAVVQARGQNDERRPVRGGKDVWSSEEHGRLAQPKQEHGRLARPKYEITDMKRRQKEGVASGTRGWQPEGFPLPERAYSGLARDGRRGTGMQSSFDRSTDRHKVRSAAPLHSVTRRKPAEAVELPERSATRREQHPISRRKPREAEGRGASASKRSVGGKRFSHKI